MQLTNFRVLEDHIEMFLEKSKDSTEISVIIFCLLGKSPLLKEKYRNEGGQLVGGVK